MNEIGGCQRGSSRIYACTTTWTTVKYDVSGAAAATQSPAIVSPPKGRPLRRGVLVLVAIAGFPTHNFFCCVFCTLQDYSRGINRPVAEMHLYVFQIVLLFLHMLNNVNIKAGNAIA